MKIAIIGDSFSAYNQDGQQENSWTYLLSQHFPQHQYINYSIGGRGYDHYRIAMLDAKMKDVDVVLTNETFNERILSTITGSELFLLDEEVSANYKTYNLRNIYWYSIHSDTLIYFGDQTNKIPESIEKALLETLRNTAASSKYHLYNTEWWNNVDKLYNFKHIVKLELLYNPNLKDTHNIGAYYDLQNAHGIIKEFNEYQFANPQNIGSQNHNYLTKLMYKKGLIVSETDDHWSPYSNKWVFHNYILPKVIDILS